MSVSVTAAAAVSPVTLDAMLSAPIGQLPPRRAKRGTVVAPVPAAPAPLDVATINAVAAIDSLEFDVSTLAYGAIVSVPFYSVDAEPGYNVRVPFNPDADCDKSDKGASDVTSDAWLVRSIVRDGQCEPIEVRHNGTGGLWIVQGHRRHAAISYILANPEWAKQAVANGHNLHNVTVTLENPARTALDRTKDLARSNSGRPLTGYELGRVAVRLEKEHKLKLETIALELSKSPRHVQVIMAQATAPAYITTHIESGVIGGQLAYDLRVAYGTWPAAGAVINRALVLAKVQAKPGRKPRITAATITAVEAADSAAKGAEADKGKGAETLPSNPPDAKPAVLTYLIVGMELHCNGKRILTAYDNDVLRQALALFRAAASN